MGPRSWVPLKYFGVPVPRCHLDILGSWAPGPGVQPVDVLGPGSHSSSMGLTGPGSHSSDLI